jgi:hypothetical protein
MSQMKVGDLVSIWQSINFPWVGIILDYNSVNSSILLTGHRGEIRRIERSNDTMYLQNSHDDHI